MLYKSPDQWTEELFRNLPDEDDRYEYKSGRMVDAVISGKKLKVELENDLGREIGALVNSFGGTLFIGVEDKTKEIDGCPLIVQGRETTKEWLEKKIPEWFDFRLYSFRINTVMLTPDTQEAIGDDRCLLHIDLWDSGYLPHQLKSDHRYYYREGSVSKAAPHYYLSFLTNSRSPAMSDKVRRWCLEFLNPALVFLKDSLLFLSNRTFKVQFRTIRVGTSVSEIEFFDWAKWLDFVSGRNLAGKQFFYVYPAAKERCMDLYDAGMLLARRAESFRRQIAAAPTLMEYCRRFLLEVNESPNYRGPAGDLAVAFEIGDHFRSPLPLLGAEEGGREVLGALSRMTLWQLMDLTIANTLAEDAGLWAFAGNLAVHLESDPEIRKFVAELDGEFVRISENLTELIEFLDGQRDELTATYSTTYF